MTTNVPPIRTESGDGQNGRMIVVSFDSDGWRLSCAATGETLLFVSGGRAESHARAMAMRMAAAGHDACVEIRDRRNVVAGSLIYSAARDQCRTWGKTA